MISVGSIVRGRELKDTPPETFPMDSKGTVLPPRKKESRLYRELFIFGMINHFDQKETEKMTLAQKQRFRNQIVRETEKLVKRKSEENPGTTYFHCDPAIVTEAFFNTPYGKRYADEKDAWLNESGPGSLRGDIMDRANDWSGIATTPDGKTLIPDVMLALSPYDPVVSDSDLFRSDDNDSIAYVLGYARKSSQPPTEKTLKKTMDGYDMSWRARYTDKSKYVDSKKVPHEPGKQHYWGLNTGVMYKDPNTNIWFVKAAYVDDDPKMKGVLRDRSVCSELFRKNLEVRTQIEEAKANNDKSALAKLSEVVRPIHGDYYESGFRKVRRFINSEKDRKDVQEWMQNYYQRHGKANPAQHNDALTFMSEACKYLTDTGRSFTVKLSNEAKPNLVAELADGKTQIRLLSWDQPSYQGRIYDRGTSAYISTDIYLDGEQTNISQYIDANARMAFLKWYLGESVSMILPEDGRGSKKRVGHVEKSVQNLLDSGNIRTKNVSTVYFGGPNSNSGVLLGAVRRNDSKDIVPLNVVKSKSAGSGLNAIRDFEDSMLTPSKAKLFNAPKMVKNAEGKSVPTNEPGRTRTTFERMIRQDFLIEQYGTEEEKAALAAGKIPLPTDHLFDGDDYFKAFGNPPDGAGADPDRVKYYIHYAARQNLDMWIKSAKKEMYPLVDVDELFAAVNEAKIDSAKSAARNAVNRAFNEAKTKAEQEGRAFNVDADMIRHWQELAKFAASEEMERTAMRIAVTDDKANVDTEMLYIDKVDINVEIVDGKPVGVSLENINIENANMPVDIGKVKYDKSSDDHIARLQTEMMCYIAEGNHTLEEARAHCVELIDGRVGNIPEIHREGLSFKDDATKPAHGFSPEIVAKFSNVPEAAGIQTNYDFIRNMLKTLDDDYTDDFVSGDSYMGITMQNENVRFNPNTAVSIPGTTFIKNDHVIKESNEWSKVALPPFTKEMAACAMDALLNSGCHPNSIQVRVDDQGILYYEGVMPRNAQKGFVFDPTAYRNGEYDDEKSTGRAVRGYIGRILEPDEYGAIHLGRTAGLRRGEDSDSSNEVDVEEEGEDAEDVTSTNTKDGKVIIPGYEAMLVPDDPSHPVPMKERLRLFGIESSMRRRIQRSIRTAVFSLPAQYDFTTHVTDLTSVYTKNYSASMSESEYQSWLPVDKNNPTPEEQTRLNCIEALRGRCRFPN